VKPFDSLNRPMFEEDVEWVISDPWAHRLRRLVAEYREQGLAVVNGALAYSNLLEGPAQMLTCHPYRQWEYASLFRVLGDSLDGRTFLDVGGAGSPLPCLLAENGARGVALDLQPLLVELSNHISHVRGLDLKAEVADAVTLSGRSAEFDVVICISVLEHVPPANRQRLLRNVSRTLKPGGLLYLTFDYGTYVAGDLPRTRDTRRTGLDESLSDVTPLCEALEETGFVFVGNDPRELPREVLALKAAPHHAVIAHRLALNRPPFDAGTPWPQVGRYLARRLGLGRRPRTRYARHNFFRLFACKE
jgi:2-polyprenyl-3-methyl-5-hydroxy-6-metoxy-1,4-benzoquinol methylase